MPTRSEAVQRFLKHYSPLADAYNLGMECQVNVAQDNGEMVTGEFNGRVWRGYSDGLTTWKAFRIPWNAASEPEYTDSEIKFDLEKHVEGIGLTGWNWRERASRWVAYDFDAITGHSDKHEKKLTTEELGAVQSAVTSIPWITVRRSTGGKGLHLYVTLDPPVPTSNHTEHAALARSILGHLSALTGYDFLAKVDTCGGNMWVWHRKMLNNPEGLKVIKEGVPLTQVPLNWKDHIGVVTNKRKRATTSLMPESNDKEVTDFDLVCGQQTILQRDEEHKALIVWLQKENCLFWWDSDRNMLVCHTADLKRAHSELGLRGIFDTLAQGTERGSDQNCFAFPLRKGGWSIRRHTRGVAEATTWDQDTSGWTRCLYNVDPDFRTACRSFSGVEDEKGNFVFPSVTKAEQAAKALGVKIPYPKKLEHRSAMLSQHKDGRLIFKIEASDKDAPSEMEGYLEKKGFWSRIERMSVTPSTESEVENTDDLLRHVVTEKGEDFGWYLNKTGEWHNESKDNVKDALNYMGKDAGQIKDILGASVMRCWQLVNRPFQPEYPGDRKWNRNAAQLRFLPSVGKDSYSYPTWSRIFQHCGQSIDSAIKSHPWCQANGLATGADYLKCWLASLLKEPLEPLPYLFFYGEQNTGKSSFHEAIALLVTSGYQRADLALTNSSGFNGELQHAVLCVVEETDLQGNKVAYNRIKDWVTSKHLNVRHMYQAPFHVPNCTHWVQCANDHRYCPIFPGDTRITMLHVPPLDMLNLIPKKDLFPLLEKEAPDLLADLLRLELPKSNDRLNLPVIMSDMKFQVQAGNRTELERFIDENCFPIKGASISFLEFSERFVLTLEPEDVPAWTRKKIKESLPPQYPYGKATFDGGQNYIGNISFKAETPAGKPWVVDKLGWLRPGAE
jgi:hypothetical protein